MKTLIISILTCQQTSRAGSHDQFTSSEKPLDGGGDGKYRKMKQRFLTAKKMEMQIHPPQTRRLRGGL